MKTPDYFAAAHAAHRLGNYAEALAALDQLAAKHRHEPEAMELRWRIYADQGQWAICVDIARTMTLQYRGDARGWLCLADSIRNVAGGTLQMAYDILSSAARRIAEPILLLTLARYAAQLGRFADTQEWLAKADAAGGILVADRQERGTPSPV